MTYQTTYTPEERRQRLLNHAEDIGLYDIETQGSKIILIDCRRRYTFKVSGRTTFRIEVDLNGAPEATVTVSDAKAADALTRIAEARS